MAPVFRIALSAGAVMALWLVATPTQAQSMLMPRYGQAIAAQNAGMKGDINMDRYRLENEAERLNREAEDRDAAESRYGAERVALADHVQALIEEGRCREAREMAVEAGERTMAVRVRQTCRR